MDETQLTSQGVWCPWCGAGKQPAGSNCTGCGRQLPLAAPAGAVPQQAAAPEAQRANVIGAEAGDEPVGWELSSFGFTGWAPPPSPVVDPAANPAGPAWVASPMEPAAPAAWIPAQPVAPADEWPVAAAPAPDWGQAATSPGLVQAASFGQRLAARIIDGIILALVGLVPPVLVIVAVLNRPVGLGGAFGALIVLLLVLEVLPLLATLIYRLGSDGGRGRSVGRAALGIRLVRVDLNGQIVAASRVGYWRALGRLLVGGLGDSLFFLSSLSMLWDPQRRTWADKATGTAVVRDTRAEAGPGRVLAATIFVTAAFTGLAAIGGLRLGQSATTDQSRQVSATTTYTPGYGDPPTDPGPGTYETAAPYTAAPYSAVPQPPTITYQAPAPAVTAAPLPQASASPAPSASGSDDSGSGSASASSVDPSVAVPQTLSSYFQAINSGNYPQAWQLFDAHQRQVNGSLSHFETGLATSSDSNVSVGSVTDNGDGTASVPVSFTSMQDAGHGPSDDPSQTCTNWTVTYRLKLVGGSYLIDGTSDASHSAC